MYELNKPEYYWQSFDGSRNLFNACWKKYRSFLKGAIDDPSCDSDVNSWLDTIAAEMVNNPRSKFYLHG